MKVGEFQKAIKVTSTAYQRFMGQHGPTKGFDSSVNVSAWAFFKKRELQGIKTMPNKKMKASASAAGGKNAEPNLDDVELEGEKDDKVPIYGMFCLYCLHEILQLNIVQDTCDEIRRKINAHLKKPGGTQASFRRSISASYQKATKKITSSQLSVFRSKKGALSGNTSGVFYGAYVYFEKLRIKENKPKNKKREEMEQICCKKGGIDISDRHDRFLCRPDERPMIDSYGRLDIVRV